MFFTLFPFQIKSHNITYIAADSISTNFVGFKNNNGNGNGNGNGIDDNTFNQEMSNGAINWINMNRGQINSEVQNYLINFVDEVLNNFSSLDSVLSAIRSYTSTTCEQDTESD